MSNETDLWRRFRAAHTACALLVLKLRPKFASLLDTSEDLTTVYAGVPIEIKAEAQEDRLQLLLALKAQGAPDVVVSDAESVLVDRRLCQLLNPPLNASATTRLLRRLLMSIGCSALEYLKKMLKLHESIEIIYSFVSGT